MSPARKAGREGGRSGRLARGPGSPGTRLSAGRRRRPPPAGPCARGCAESPPPGTLRTVPCGLGQAGASNERNLCESVGERERKWEPTSLGTGGPALGGGREPTAQQAKTRAPSGAPSSGHILPPTPCTSMPGHRLHIQTALGHTQRHTKTHTGLWPVTLTLRRVHTASQMHIRTPLGHTHIPSLVHTLLWSHTHSSGETTQEHTRRHSLPWTLTITPQTTSRHTGCLNLHTLLPRSHCTELSAASLQCSSRKGRVRAPPRGIC